MSIKITGKVHTRTEVAQGQSQARIAVKIDLGQGQEYPAELIISSTEMAALGPFKPGLDLNLTSP